MMKKIALILCVALMAIGVCWAGSAGLTNKVVKGLQPGGSGDTYSLQARIVEFNDRVVTFADAISASGTALDASTLSGNAPAASLTNAMTQTIQPAYPTGTFEIASTTQLVFVASGVTNVIDADITN